MSEYDAQSRASNQKYRDNYDAIFRKAKKERKERSKEREREHVIPFEPRVSKDAKLG